jgi:hypothetical protein
VIIRPLSSRNKHLSGDQETQDRNQDLAQENLYLTAESMALAASPRSVEERITSPERGLSVPFGAGALILSKQTLTIGDA